MKRITAKNDKPIKWFVMLRGNNGSPVPMVRDCYELALFDSRENAEDAAKINPLGLLFGYEVFAWE